MTALRSMRRQSALLCVCLGLLLLSGRESFAQSPAACRAKVSAPVIAPAAGTYTASQAVKITTASKNTAIYFTLDGSKPTTSSTRYSAPIAVSSNKTVNAIAVPNGCGQSAIASASYIIVPPAASPLFSLAPGNYSSIQSVAIADTTPGAIYFTTDGSTPTTASSQYSGPISLIVGTQTLRAIAIASGYSISAASAATYTVTPPTAAPVFGTPAGSYSTTQMLSLASATPAAVIFYTTDGSIPTAASTRYSGPIFVGATSTISAMAMSAGYTPSPTVSATYTITLPAATPIAVPVAGQFTAPQQVKLFDATPGAAIYYTTDGSAPTTSSPKYTGPILVSSTATLQSIATAPGYTQSAVASSAYTISSAAPMPIFAPPAGTYASAQTVSIADAAPGATIYYTTDGTAPTKSSAIYFVPIIVAASTKINAIAVTPGASESMLANAAYTIAPAAATPVFTPPAGTYLSAQTVAISSATPKATIYYTTDGTSPNLSSAIYKGPIAVSSSETINAVVFAPGATESAMASASYSITPPAATPALSPAGGTYTKTQTVSITCATPGAAIYFTTDGSTPTTASPFYSGAFQVAANTTVQAIAMAPNDSQSETAQAIYTITPPTASPLIVPKAGTYTSAQTVTLSDSTAGAAIYFTTDGSTPTTASAQYTAPITVGTTQTLRALALAPGDSLSPLVSAAFTIALPAATPVISPSGGIFASAQLVAITDATHNAAIFYTTDGTAPTASSLAYAGPITIASTQTIRAIALAPGSSISIAASGVFTMEGALSIPTPMTLPSGSAGAPYSATIQAAGDGPAYTWTVNGVSVGANSAAVALGSGLTASSNGSAALTISGTPASTGSVSFTVAVTDNYTGNQAGPLAFSIAVAQPSQLSLPAPNPTSLGPATAHEAYAGYIISTGGASPYTWTVSGLPSTMQATTSSAIATVAGTGAAGFSGDSGPATQAQINAAAVVVDGAGNIYFADSATSRVRMISANGIISTIAGTGTAGYNGDNIPAATAELNNPSGLAVDAAGDLYIADTGNARVRVVSAATGLISTVAGTGIAGYSGDGLAAQIAKLDLASGVVVDAMGDLFIADSGNARVREVSAASGTITTVAGTGVAGFSGDNGPATIAQLRNPIALAVDTQGNLYILDLTGKAGATATSARIREVSATGTIFTIAGTGTAGYNGDNLAAANAQLSSANGIAVDAAGNLYIADAGNNRIREVSAGMSLITTVAGTGTAGYSGDSGPAALSNVTGPQGIYVDNAGNLYFSDSGSRVREVQASSQNGFLVIAGTPQTPGTIPFQVFAQDATGMSAGPMNYSIQVSSPLALALPVPNPDTLPAGIAQQPYSGTIVAAGGVPNYTWWVNGSKLAGNGTALPIGNGLTASSNGSNMLTIAGTPTTVGNLTFRAYVQDGMSHSAGWVSYSIDIVSAAGYQVSGQMTLVNCNAPAPGITLTLNTTPAQVVSTDSNGTFEFENVPNGTYTVTPSSNAPSSIFYPAVQSITVNGSNLAGANFQAAIGYNLSGSVGYVPGVGGRVYMSLVNTTCPSVTLGTSSNGSGPFTIRGLQPGTYTLQAWVDELGYGKQNASDPAATIGNIVVSNANVSSIQILPVAPSPVMLSTAPVIREGGGFGGGALLGYTPIVNNSGVEQAFSYTLQWSTTPTFSSIVSSHTFAASGVAPENVWIVNGLRTGGVYYFRAQGTAGNSVGPWSNVYGPITIANPAMGNTVSGAITFAATASGPMYLGFRDNNTGRDYISEIGKSVSPQSYSVKVPTGSNYTPFAILDQNNDWMADTGDLNGLTGNPTIAITGNTTQNIVLPAPNIASVTTQHFRLAGANGTVDSYGLSFDIPTIDILPWRVSLLSGPNVLAPLDIGQCLACNSDPYDFWLDIGPSIPSAGDTYSLQLYDPMWAGGTFVTTNAAVTGVVNAFVSDPAATPGSGGTATPTFTWSAPANASSYTFQFTLTDANGNTIWQIPAANAPTSGFSSAITSIQWGVDPTGATNPPSIASLTPGATYFWSIQIQDSNGNTAEMPVSYQP